MGKRDHRQRPDDNNRQNQRDQATPNPAPRLSSPGQTSASGSVAVGALTTGSTLTAGWGLTVEPSHLVTWSLATDSDGRLCPGRSVVRSSDARSCSSAAASASSDYHRRVHALPQFLR